LPALAIVNSAAGSKFVSKSSPGDVVVEFPAAAKPVFEFMELSGMPMYETVDEICCEEVVLKWANNYLVVM
jgi:hypothetical protein